jgi:hypothetical protein
MSAGVTGGVPKGVTPQHLSKVWRISFEEAKNTIAKTSQHVARDPNPTLLDGMARMIVCFDTKGSRISFSWTPSSRQRKVESQRVGIPAASYSSLTKDLSMWCEVEK